MQTETPREKKQIERIVPDRIADEINSKYRDASRYAAESINSSNAAIQAAIACGKLLARAKDIVRHGKWLKWLMDNCPEISHDTASKWIALANFAHERNLETCNGLTQAYIACGILPDPKQEKKPLQAIGTADVIINDEFETKALNRLDKTYTFLVGSNVEEMPEPHRKAVKENLKPFVELWERL